ncbi:MAG: MFS transporter [Acidobacteriales bacterium]|nr:MAG: MFS transporter [Terriglobales bacterium]
MTTAVPPVPHENRSRKLVGLVFLLFFLISLLTNIMGPLIPEVIRSFRLSLGAAGLLPFAFFLSYGLVSIPAGMLVERTSAKKVLLWALALQAVGSLLFPSYPLYISALASFFLIGIGAAALQVVVNPLLRVAGGEEHFAFNSALAQFVFGAGSFLGPLLYSYLVLNLGRESPAPPWLRALDALTPRALPWVSVFWVFAVAIVAVLAVTAAVRVPRIVQTEEESAGSWDSHLRLFRMPVVWLYFITIFLYVGLEQGLANWMSQFLFTYHNVDPRTTGALAVSWFWGTMTLACLVGMVLLRLFDGRRLLIGVSAAAIVTFTIAVAGPARASLIAFPAMGIFLSLMWPIAFSLGLNSLSHSHGVFAGILCSAIVGGAILPPLIGQLGDHFGLRAGMLLLYISMGWIFGVGFWAKPLVNNATIRS